MYGNLLQVILRLERSFTTRRCACYFNNHAWTDPRVNVASFVPFDLFKQSPVLSLLTEYQLCGISPLLNETVYEL